MNGFEQLKSFYSWVFNNPDKVRPTHISLYVFLLNQNNRNFWAEWFKCPFDLAMQGACIGNKNTYYKCLDDLQSFKLIEYKKGINNYKAPLIKLLRLYDTEPLTEQVTVPQSAPQLVPQTEPLTGLLNKNIYKLLTINYKLINLKLETWIKNENSDKFNFKNSLSELVGNEVLVNDYIALRKAKKAPMSETVFNSLVDECNKHNYPIEDALKISIEKNWQGFKFEWLKNPVTQNQNKPYVLPHGKIAL